MKRQETERTTQGWSRHTHSGKTCTKTSEKPDETEALVLGGSQPVDKAEPTEKTPDGSPPSQVNSLHLSSKFPHQNIGQYFSGYLFTKDAKTAFEVQGPCESRLKTYLDLDVQKLIHVLDFIHRTQQS